MFRRLIFVTPLILGLAGCTTGGGVGTNPTADEPKPTASVTHEPSEPTTAPTPEVPRVSLECRHGSGYSQKFSIERVEAAPPTFTHIWNGVFENCTAAEDVIAEGPVETDALAASGYEAYPGDISTLYELCASINKEHVYATATHVPTATQIAEIRGMLTLCPTHPQAELFQATVARGEVPPPPPPVWARYGTVPESTLAGLGDDYYLLMGSTVCADVQAGKIESGFLHGFITGGNLPDYVRPQANGVYMAARAIELSCPDSADDFVALLDAYDAAYGPYQ